MLATQTHGDTLHFTEVVDISRTTEIRIGLEATRRYSTTNTPYKTSLRDVLSFESSILNFKEDDPILAIDSSYYLNCCN